MSDLHLQHLGWHPHRPRRRGLFGDRLAPFLFQVRFESLTQLKRGAAAMFLVLGPAFAGG